MTFWRPVSDAFRRSPALPYLNPVKRIRRRHEDTTGKGMAKKNTVEEDTIAEDVVEEDIVEESIPPYEYEQLDLTKQQIRLITLHSAARPSETISCAIQTFDTEADLHYVALSYTWGPDHPKQTILVNGQQLLIRQNLYDFLRRYRNDPKNVHKLWIDQICISQAHEGERNHQIRLMSHIYSRSLSTIIWLGEDSREAAQQYREYRHVGDVYTLCRNIYFTRLWVVQEILLSPHKRVLCGDTWLDLDDLFRTIHTNKSRSVLDLQLIESRYTSTAHKRGHETLRYCLKRISDYNCEDPRDKVYGLMSLVRERDRLEIDYNKSTEEVFLQVVMSEFPRFKFTWELDIVNLRTLCKSMGLGDHLALLEPFFDEIRDRWASGNQMKIELGFERRHHQTTADCPNLGHVEKGCCSDRWWFLQNGVKQYRDQSSYDYRSPIRSYD